MEKERIALLKAELGAQVVRLRRFTSGSMSAVKKKAKLSAEFSRYLFDHPETEQRLPVGAEIILLPESEGLQFKDGKDIEAEGGRVAYV